MRKDLVKGFFLCFIGLYILHHARKGAVYRAAIREEFRRHGYSISFGTLYPLFCRLERDSFIHSEIKLVSGKLRRLYRITRAGETALTEGTSKVQELLEELEKDL